MRDQEESKRARNMKKEIEQAKSIVDEAAEARIAVEAKMPKMSESKERTRNSSKPSAQSLMTRALTQHFGEKNAKDAISTYQICKRMLPSKSPKIDSYIHFIEKMGEIEKLAEIEDTSEVKSFNINQEYSELQMKDNELEISMYEEKLTPIKQIEAV